MQKQDLKEMFDNAVHIGHRTHKWNPKMKKFIYGEVNGIHVIDLEKTAECLEKALDFLERLSKEGKKVLFVSTKPQSIKLIEDTAKTVKMPYVVTKWIPGLLTNFATIKTRIKYLTDLKEQERSGDFAKYTKKEASKLKKVIDKLQAALGGVENMTAMPDALFLVDSCRDAIVVKEGRKIHIPVVSIVDTNADPSVISYPIPANDDAIKSLAYIMNKVKGSFHGK
ncbi:MAG: 30S ribosomal protein S2 [Candidatus Gracilibacteria bacterium]|jgi:small subunit ribosomal protein S2